MKTPLPSLQKSDHLPGLDGLRGIACLLVFFYHLRWHARPSAEVPLALGLGSVDVERLLQSCDIGVAIFFVLSGLLLSYPFWRSILDGAPRPAIREYLWRRFCRIAPAYYAVLVVVYLVRGGTYTLYGALDFPLHATFLHNSADFSYHSVHPVLWTIGLEFQFYLLLPFIMAGLAVLWRKSGIALALVALIGGAWLLDLLSQRAFGALAPHVSERIIARESSDVIGGTIFAYLKVFAFGIAAAPLAMRWPWSRRTADAVCALSLVGTVAVIALSHEGAWRETGVTGWPINGIALGLFAAALVRSQVFARLFSARWLAATGGISYGIYLWHELVQRAVFSGTLRNSFQGASLFFLGGAVALAVTCLIAWLSWRMLERPALRTPYPFAK